MKQEIELVGPPHIFRYRPNNDYTLDELENNYIFFSDIDSLNDPFDSNPNLIKLTQNKKEWTNFYTHLNGNIKETLTNSYFQRKFTSESLEKFVQENIERFIKKFGIACFSINPINLPLWGNYAGNYKGVCLQFNADFDTNFFSGIRIVKYEKELVQKEFKPFSNEGDIIDLFYRKQENWHYEYEVRLIKNFKGKAQFKKEALRNVIFGYNTDSEYINKASEIIKRNYLHVKIYQLKKPTKINTLTFAEI
ncbi:MAG: DUF2971 domain-containing protein [Flavobacterium sp.]|nr:DUF2971 domain-containing protein [Flavobacterium sp.]